MKLIIVIISDTDETVVITRLVNEKYRVTRMAITGGFLRRGRVTLLIGVEAEQVEAVIELLRATCSPIEGEHHATLFVVDTSHFEQI